MYLSSRVKPFQQAKTLIINIIYLTVKLNFPNEQCSLNLLLSNFDIKCFSAIEIAYRMIQILNI